MSQVHGPATGKIFMYTIKWHNRALLVQGIILGALQAKLFIKLTQHLLKLNYNVIYKNIFELCIKVLVNETCHITI